MEQIGADRENGNFELNYNSTELSIPLFNSVKYNETSLCKFTSCKFLD